MSRDRGSAFLRFALECQVLRFGEFTTKAGRQSPYFFNAGLFHHGATLDRLAAFYADTIAASGIGVDLLFGPAYKGIPLAAITAVALNQRHRVSLPIAFNRKEVKDHGEGGAIIGAPLRGRVLVIDDVISAGTSVRESLAHIQRAGATLAGVVVALDRQERGQGELSAVQEVERTLGVPVLAIATLADLIQLLEASPELAGHLPAIRAYRERYGER